MSRDISIDHIGIALNSDLESFQWLAPEGLCSCSLVRLDGRNARRVGWRGVGQRGSSTEDIVSLTFDDGNADQLAAEQMIKAHGLVGTFFIATSWIDTASYLTLDNLHAMAADGNETGGHTVTHPDLTTVSAAAATAEVCDGRTTLAGWGLAVTNFAYPFAAEDAALEKIVKNCGYTSARNLGDIRSPASCATCPYAETIPPANPYNTAAPDEVDSTWTLKNLQDMVTNAETHNGGWVQLTFHHIAIGTDPTLTISPALFEQFVTWLAARTADGTTVVETVAQALGTSPPPPPVNKAPIAEFNSSAQNLVASFDGSGSTDSDGSVAAYGWDFGDGSAPGTRPKPTHTYAAPGTYQVKLTVTDNLGATGTMINPLVVRLLPGPGSVVSLPPSRGRDTRTDLGATGPVPALGSISLQITGQGVPATGVSAVIVNVTAVGPTSAGYLTVRPSGATRTTTSNLNFQAGQNIPNLVFVPVGADGKIRLSTDPPAPSTSWPTSPATSSPADNAPPPTSTRLLRRIPLMTTPSTAPPRPRTRGRNTLRPGLSALARRVG